VVNTFFPQLGLKNCAHWGKQENNPQQREILVMANKTGGDVFEREQAERMLYPAKGLAGGGQLEVRMEVSPDHPDPDIRGVARRVKFFNLESWHKEWTEVAQKNQDLAAGFEQENRNQTAHEFYLRAADFYRRAVVYMSGSRSAHAADFQKAGRKFRQSMEPGQATVRASGNPLRGTQAARALLARTRKTRQQAAGCL